MGSIKYRVHEIAKDMGVTSNEVLDVLKKYFSTEEYKHQTPLPDKAVDVVLEHFTSRRQFANLDEAKAAANKPAEKPAAKKAAPAKEKPAKAEAPKAEPKAEPVKSEPVKTEAPKAEPVKTEPAKTEPVKAEAPKVETAALAEKTTQPTAPAAAPAQTNVKEDGNKVTMTKEQNTKPADNAENKNQNTAPRTQNQGERRPQGDRPQYNNDRRPQGDRPQYNNDRRPQGDRPQFGNDRRPQGDRPQYNNDRRPQGDRPQFGNDRRPQGDRPQGDRPQYNNGERRQFNGDRPQYNNDRRPQGDRPQYNNGERRQFNGDRPQYNNDRRPQGDRPQYNNGERRQFNGDRPQYNNDRRPQGDRPQYNNGERRQFNGDRPQYNNDRRPQGDRPQFNNGERRQFNGDRPQYNNDRRQGGSQNQNAQQQRPAAPKPQQPAQPQPRISRAEQRANDPTLTRKTVSTVDEAGVIRADMRAVSVDLDKYNEKYEQIAPQSVKDKDMSARKQKLTQRSSQYNKKPQRSRAEQEAEKMRRLEMERQRRQKLEITIPDEISVSDLAARLKVQVAEIVKKLMMAGVMASASQVIDFDTAALVAMEIGAKVEKEVVLTIEDRLIDDSEDDTSDLVERCPVVVVMGHVDHGKTSLLDAIRNAQVTATEAGGITQHIGAYQVSIHDRLITFLDTPGHEAFTSMRARGAQVTDIAILVVAADDGIMPQTVEAINHAKAAGVSIIVAINKIDKPTANPDKVKQELTEYELVPEEWGGDVPCIPVSAKTHEGIEDLLEMVQLVADIKELKANPNRLAKGTVIEARLDKGRGPVATILVQNGTLHTGDIIIAGTSVGRVRVMQDDKGRRVNVAGPSTPVEITGLDEAPSAGDTFNIVEDERLARELVEQRKEQAKELAFQSYNKVTLENLFSHIEQGSVKELPIIVKADVQGSVEAVKQSLEKLSTDEVRVRVIHGAVGAVNESDVMLANASGAIIVGFNVRPDPVARDNAERDGIQIKLYRVIYDAIEEIQGAMKGMLAPKTREVDLGRAEIRMVYKISNVGTVSGCYVLEGKITRNANIRIVRDGIIIADDKLDSLKRMKDDVKEVAQGFECGMRMVKFNDVKEGDILEAYEIEEYRED